MSKTLQEQIADMETRCEKLEGLQKLFEKMVKNEFGYELKEIHIILQNHKSLNRDN